MSAAEKAAPTVALWVVASAAQLGASGETKAVPMAVRWAASWAGEMADWLVAARAVQLAADWAAEMAGQSVGLLGSLDD